MKFKKYKKGLVKTCIVFFSVCYVIPLALSSIDFFTKDYGQHLRYMVYIFLPLSIVFIIAVLKIFGFNKKRLFSLLGAFILTYLISAIYIFIKVSIDFSDFRSSSF